MHFVINDCVVRHNNFNLKNRLNALVYWITMNRNLIRNWHMLHHSATLNLNLITMCQHSLLVMNICIIFACSVIEICFNIRWPTKVVSWFVPNCKMIWQTKWMLSTNEILHILTLRWTWLGFQTFPDCAAHRHVIRADFQQYQLDWLPPLVRGGM